MRKAPWRDYEGNDIYEGDIIVHPSGESGKVIFITSDKNPSEHWYVDYGIPTLSRLCLQVGDKGRAVVSK